MKRVPNVVRLKGVIWPADSKSHLVGALAAVCAIFVVAALLVDFLLVETGPLGTRSSTESQPVAAASAPSFAPGVPTPSFEARPFPDFASIADADGRKTAFFSYLVPYANAVNAGILSQRQRIERLREQFLTGKHASEQDREWLTEIAVAYAFEPIATFDREVFADLLSRVDIIPPSLSLAQAAIESAWGSSRFAREGYNLFGMWCYEPGCGIVPERRPAGATYEVARYANPGESIQAYVRNLNTSEFYLSMRVIRRALRSRGELPTGLELALGLERYSQEGAVYLDKVQNLINANGLAKLDLLQP